MTRLEDLPNYTSFLCFVFFVVISDSYAQEKLTVSYSSVDAPSANWYIAQEKGLYKKYGLDVESIFIPASSTNVAVLVAGQLKFGNGTGGTIASAAVSGAPLSSGRLLHEHIALRIDRPGFDQNAAATQR